MSEPTRSDERADLLTKREIFALVALHALIVEPNHSYPVDELARQCILIADELQKNLNESRGNFIVES